MTRRERNYQIANFQFRDGLQVLADAPDMPAVNVGRGWFNDVPRLLQKRVQLPFGFRRFAGQLLGTRLHDPRRHACQHFGGTWTSFRSDRSHGSTLMGRAVTKICHGSRTCMLSIDQLIHFVPRFHAGR